MQKIIHCATVWSLMALLACSAALAAPAGSITKSAFGKTTDSQAVDIFTLRNANGVEARITNYGGIVVSLKVPGRDGKLGDVVLGYDDLAGYLKATPYFGALIGRYGNRIANGAFTLDGKTFQLAKNDHGINHLHGGKVGFDKVVWEAKPKMTKNGPTLTLTYVSKDGEEGYPGTLTVKAVYMLTNRNSLRLDFTATTDKDTVLNLTNHSYFNLAGAGNGDILKHQMMLNASKMVPVDKNLIPTGELRAVAGTPFDFTKPAAIGARINDGDEQIKLGGGYDHCWVIDRQDAKAGRPALMARVYEPTSGRVMEVFSTAPGVQFYTGNFLDGTLVGKGGKAYPRRAAFCLEPEVYPDTPNKPAFPTAELKPGQTYRHTIVYRFSVKK